SPTKIALPEFTRHNYRQIAALYYLRLFGRTLQLSLVSTAICVVFGYPLAYVLARARPLMQTLGLFLFFMPFMVLPLMAAIERIPPSLEEAAQNLGANWYQMFAKTIMPLSLPGLVSGCLLVFSLSLSAFVTPALLGSPRARMVGQQIYDEVLVSFNWPIASALALALVLLTAGVVFFALVAMR